MAEKPNLAADDIDGRADHILGLLGDDPAVAAKDNAAPTSDGGDEPRPADVEAALAKLETPAAPDKVEQPKQDSGAENPPTAEDKGSDEPATPAINAPKFWNAEAKEAFKALPPNLQREVLRQEEEAVRARSRSIEEAAAERRAAEQARAKFEQETQAASQERARLIQNIDTAIQAVIATNPLLAEGAKPEYWVDLASKVAPQEFQIRRAEFDGAVQRINGLAQQRQQLAVRQADEFAKQRESYFAEQNRQLLDKIPEWQDGTKAQTGFKSVLDYAQTEYGANAQELRQADHRVIVALHREMTARQENAALKAENEKLKAGQEAARKSAELKRDTPAPRVAKPQAQADRTNETNPRARDLRNLARKTGRDDDRMAAILAAVGDR